MPRLQVSEPVEPHPDISEQFSCGQAGSAPIDIYRLLTGTLDIVHPLQGRNVRCRANYLTNSVSRGKTSDRKLSRGLFGEDVSIEDARNILAKLRVTNGIFFSKLAVELTHCVFNIKIHRHVEAFLYFYRSLEKLAVAFPILYVAGQPDFQKAHQILKSLIQKPGEGELVFIGRFCKMIADQSDVLGEYRVQFRFPVEDLDHYGRILSEIKLVISENIRDVMVEEEGYFELPYKSTPSLLIDCRNRLFHNSNTGQRNFDIDEIGGASDLCQGLVEAGLHWLALTYLEVVRNRAAQV